MDIFVAVAFIMALFFMFMGFYLLKKSIDSLSHKCYRNCDFTINQDQLEEFYDFLRMLQEENLEGRS